MGQGQQGPFPSAVRAKTDSKRIRATMSRTDRTGERYTGAFWRSPSHFFDDENLAPSTLPVMPTTQSCCKDEIKWQTKKKQHLQC